MHDSRPAWLYGDRLRLVGIKLYADGALGSRGAWLKQPYADKPDTRGLQLPHRRRAARRSRRRRPRRGFQLAIHAIGDAANAQVDRRPSKRSAKTYGRDRRWRIEHFQVADPSRHPAPRHGRDHRLDAADPPDQRPDDGRGAARTRPRLGGAYAWATHRARSARGSPSAPTFRSKSPNPFPGLAAAVSRQDLNGQPPGGWRPQERVSFEQALAGFTRGAAYAGFAEEGSAASSPANGPTSSSSTAIRPRSTPQALARTQVLETWVAGKKVWARAASAAGAERGK